MTGGSVLVAVLLLRTPLCLVFQIAIGQALHSLYDVVGEYLYNATTQNCDEELFQVFLHRYLLLFVVIVLERTPVEL